MEGFNETSLDCLEAPFPKSSQIVLMLLCSLCLLSAVGGNILVLLAVYTTRSLHNSSMYFLASLSIADLMVGLFMTTFYIAIIATYDNSIALSDTVWDLLHHAESFTWVATLTATTLSLCAVTIDRYIAVMFSLRYRELVTTPRCVVVIISLWAFSVVFAGSLFICGDDFAAKRIFWVVCFVLVVGIPFVVILFCNFKLTLAARRQARLIHEASVHSGVDVDNETSRNRNTAKNRKATITAIIISIVFFALFFPQLVVFIILLVTDDECFVSELQIVWFWVAIISFFHSVINPWIYCIRSREFRKAMKKTLFH